jgi:hypothetical protein
MNTFLAVLCIVVIVVVLVAAPFIVPPLRRALIAKRLLGVFRKMMPPMSQTERDALEAGTVGWDGELFSGRPAWRDLLAMPRTKLTADEQHFLDNEVETLCAMTSDWEATNVYKDLPPRVWQYIKDHGFLGMSAVGIAPASIMPGSFRSMPVKMSSPRPPPPIRNASGAVPTLTASAVRIPANMTNSAFGSSTPPRICSGRMPIPVAASMKCVGTPSTPA